MKKVKKLSNAISNIEKILKNEDEIASGFRKELGNLDESFIKNLTKEKLGNLYSENIDEMYENREKIKEKLNTMSENEKLVIGNGNPGLFGEGCRAGISGYKTPTGCDGCHTGKKNIEDLGLEKYVEFKGDRIYQIPDNVFKNALVELMPDKEKIRENLESKLKEIYKKENKLRENSKEIEKDLEIYERFESNGVDIENIQNLMPEFYELIKTKSGFYAAIESKENVGVLLKNESYNSGSAGMEYGITVIVSRDGKTKKEYFKWRDAYSSKNDILSNNFSEVSIEEILDDKITVHLKRRDAITKRSFFLKNQKKI